MAKHYKWKEIKSQIITCILQSDGQLSEAAIRGCLADEFGTIDHSIVNRHLHDLKEANCVMLIPPEKKGLGNYWSIPRFQNLISIQEHFPNLPLNTFEKSLKIVLDEFEDVLISSTSPEEIEKYKGYAEIKEYLSKIRENLNEKLRISNAFFKLCVRDSDSLYRNVMVLSEISEDGSGSHAFVGDNFKLFVLSTSGIDIAFKACVVMDIMARKGNVGKDMKKVIEYVKQMNNAIPENQLGLLKKYYEKTQIAPYFIRDAKFVSVSNYRLSELQKDYEKRGGKWDFLKKQELDGSA